MSAILNATAMQAAQIPASGAALARAFYDDPLMTYILQDEQRRANALQWFMTAATKYGYRYGEVYTTPDRVDGDAIWLPPGDVKVTTGRMIKNGMLMAPLKFGIGAFQRFLKAVNFYEHMHMRDAPEPHWYLMVLGVDPPQQGKGVGSALVAPMLARADAERLPCYLETNKTRNVPFYQRHGFEVVVEGDISGGGPHFWTMKRPARA